MRTLGAVLDDETMNGPARLDRKSRAVDRRDSFFVVKYAALGKNKPIYHVIKHLRNLYKLKWLRPRVVFSRHMNLQEKLLGDLRRKLLFGVVDADFGPRPCNCPKRFKVDGQCAYSSGSRFTCRTAGSVYKISCKIKDCNCFYIGKSQRYVKTRVQEHIGEVTKLYNKLILLPNRSASSTPPPIPSSGSSTRSSTLLSLGTQSMNDTTSYEDPIPSQLSQGLCLPINAALPQTPTGLTITRVQSDVSDIDSPPEILPTIVPHRRFNNSIEAQQDNCSALARHLFAHVRNLQFHTKAEVAEWCRTNILVEIIWNSSTLGLVKTAGQKACQLCAMERIIIVQSLTSFFL